MATVTFLRKNYTRLMSVEVRSQEYRTLLSLIRQFKLSERCHCNQGECGNCAVQVVPVQAGDEQRELRLEKREKTILYSAGKLTQQQYEAAQVPAASVPWRLACQYMVRYEDIFVAV